MAPLQHECAENPKFRSRPLPHNREINGDSFWAAVSGAILFRLSGHTQSYRRPVFLLSIPPRPEWSITLGACRSMHVDRFGAECFDDTRRDEGATPRCDRRATKYSAEQAASSGQWAYSDRLLGYENRSQAACREMPNAEPIAAQLTQRSRSVSTCVWSTARVASTEALHGRRALKS
jgi:hypothetical protein